MKKQVCMVQSHHPLPPDQHLKIFWLSDQLSLVRSFSRQHSNPSFVQLMIVEKAIKEKMSRSKANGK